MSGRGLEPSQNLRDKTYAAGYRRGEHLEDDIQDNTTTYVPSSLKNQRTLVHRYQTWLDAPDAQNLTDQLSALIGTVLKPLTLDDGARVPHIAEIRDYVRFVVKVSHDRLDDGGKVTVDSLVVYMERFFAAFTRVTSLIVTPDYRHSVYENIDVVLLPESDGWKIIYKIDQRWVKNNRDPDNIVYGASTSQCSRLLHDDTQFLLALALADNAFFGINSPEELWSLKIPPGDDHLKLLWKKEVQNLPILRSATRTQGVTQEPMPFGQFDKIVKRVMGLAGFYEPPTVHAIRRNLGKKVDENYTPVQRSQHLTQSDIQVFGEKYTANTSSVDGRSAFFNTPAQHDHVEHFQSCAPIRERGLPLQLPAQHEAAVKLHPDLLALEKALCHLEEQKEAPSIISVARKEAKNLRRRLLQQRLKTYQYEWVEKQRQWKILTRGSQTIQNGTTDLLDIISRVVPEHGRLRKIMTTDKIFSEAERKQNIQDLCALASSDCNTMYRPGENPIKDVCPVDGCGLHMSSLKKDQRSIHINKCRHVEIANSLKRQSSELKYCYCCFDWFLEENWTAHCETHLNSITSKWCAVINYCGTLFRPAFCPFCLGNTDLTACRRFSSWTRHHKFWTHCQAHVAARSWPSSCPHPLCDDQFANQVFFVYHLKDEHGLPVPQAYLDRAANGCNVERSIRWEGALTGQKRKKQEQLHNPVLDSASPTVRQGDVSLRHGIHTEPLSTHPMVDDPQLPDLGQSGSISPSDPSTPGSSLPSGIYQLNEAATASWPDNHDVSVAGEHNLFSQYLRSRSSSVVGTSDIGQAREKETSQTVNSRFICLSAEADSTETDIIDRTILEPIASVKRPRITLRLRQPKPAPKRRVRLRLSQPKRPS